MTEEEIVQEAQKVIEEGIERESELGELAKRNLVHAVGDEYSQNKYREQIAQHEANLNSWLAHKAEFDEWQKYVADVTARENADPDYFAKFPSIVDKSRFLQGAIIRKAKAIRGVE